MTDTRPPGDDKRDPVTGGDVAQDVHTGEIMVKVDGPVATLILHRPGKRNSVTRKMWRQLAAHMRELGDNGQVRVIAVRGHGTMFSAGADLPEVIAAAGDHASARIFCVEVAHALHALATSPKLTVALLEHHVSGGGAEIALACDLRLAQDDVQFSVPVARMGLVPDRLTVRRLLSLCGPGATRSILLLARSLNAAQCHRLGLIDELVAVGGLDEAVGRMVDDLAHVVDYSTVNIKAMLVREESLGGLDDLVEEFVASMVHGGVADNGRRHYASLRPPEVELP